MRRGWQGIKADLIQEGYIRHLGWVIVEDTRAAFTEAKMKSLSLLAEPQACNGQWRLVVVGRLLSFEKLSAPTDKHNTKTLHT